jgi:hypothetical protein
MVMVVMIRYIRRRRVMLRWHHMMWHYHSRWILHRNPLLWYRNRLRCLLPLFVRLRLVLLRRWIRTVWLLHRYKSTVVLSFSLSLYNWKWWRTRKERTALERERVNLENESKREKGGRGKEGIRGWRIHWVGFVNAVEGITVGLNDIGLIITVGFKYQGYALYDTVLCVLLLCYVSVSVPGSAARTFFRYPRSHKGLFTLFFVSLFSPNLFFFSFLRKKKELLFFFLFLFDQNYFFLFKEEKNDRKFIFFSLFINIDKAIF